MNVSGNFVDRERIDRVVPCIWAQCECASSPGSDDARLSSPTLTERCISLPNRGDYLLPLCEKLDGVEMIDTLSTAFGLYRALRLFDFHEGLLPRQGWRVPFLRFRSHSGRTIFFLTSPVYVMVQAPANLLAEKFRAVLTPYVPTPDAVCCSCRTIFCFF